MFTVELRPGETTIVSWKKLLKDANKVNGSASTSAPEPPANAHPASSPASLRSVSLSLSMKTLCDT
ncbi:ubinuclein-1 [Quercus suber]|uniref:Ubinuclein-1 n=1 Tax=Quercus suber TaxID=58331 RepID=A0AAW0MBN2_QUESU